MKLLTKSLLANIFVALIYQFLGHIQRTLTELLSNEIDRCEVYQMETFAVYTYMLNLLCTSLNVIK